MISLAQILRDHQVGVHMRPGYSTDLSGPVPLSWGAPGAEYFRLRRGTGDLLLSGHSVPTLEDPDRIGRSLPLANAAACAAQGVATSVEYGFLRSGARKTLHRLQLRLHVMLPATGMASQSPRQRACTCCGEPMRLTFWRRPYR